MAVSKCGPLLLLIESPGKIKKISQYLKDLGIDAAVKASMGHIRELGNSGEDNRGFELEASRVISDWQVNAGKQKNLAEIKKLAKGRTVILATDGDREGESIAWHLSELLKLKNPDRIVYSEITKEAIKAALAKPRKLDRNLVGAALGRAHLDKMVGYSGSKRVVWPLNIGAKSMGRVQSSALWILWQREVAIQSFKPQPYISLSVNYQEGMKAFYKAGRTEGQGGQLERSAVQGDEGREELAPESDRITSEAEAKRIMGIAQSSPHTVVSVEAKKTTQNPPAPFTTSTLQQAAGSKCKLSPDQTMSLAQKLYEGGYITYMRTDSVMLADTFCATVRRYLEQHDPQNVPQKVAKHSSKDGAQEAHEAIRPTDINLTPQAIQSKVDAAAAALYTLIWERTIATQCAPAQLNKVRIVTQAGTTHWEARGQSVLFAGYTCYWNNLSGDSLLPSLKPEQSLTLKDVKAEKKQTQPPSRYSEPSLVMEMEKKGIGRPSTYASTIKTLKDREYIKVGSDPKTRGKIAVTSMGVELMGVLDKLLPNIVRPEFTAQMETALDQVASGKLDWQSYLNQFYSQTFNPALNAASKAIGATGSSKSTALPGTDGGTRTAKSSTQPNAKSSNPSSKSAASLASTPPVSKLKKRP